jgi:anti-anti-sigma factor
MSQLDMKTEPLEDAWILRLRGDLDGETASGLENELNALRYRGQCTLLEMSHVRSVGADAIQTLERAAGHINRDHWPLFIVCPSEEAIAALERSGTLTRLAVIPVRRRWSTPMMPGAVNGD